MAQEVNAAVIVRLTHREREQVKQCARRGRWSMSEWLRMAAIAKLEQARGNGK